MQTSKDGKKTAEKILSLCATAMQILSKTPMKAMIKARKALEYAEKLGDRYLIAESCVVYGEVYMYRYEQVLAMPLFERAHRISMEINCADTLYRAQISLARLYLAHGNPVEAARMLEECVQYYTKTGAAGQRANALARLSEVQVLVGKPELALENILAVVQYAEEHEDIDLLARGCQFLAVQYFYLGEPELEEMYCYKGLRYARMIEDQRMESLGLVHLANMFIRRKQMPEAKTALQQANILRKMGVRRYPLFHTWALWHSLMGHKKQASLYRRKAMEDVRREGLKLRTIGMCLDTGDSLVKQGEHREAVYYWEIALQTAKEVDSKFLINESCQRLADSYQELNEIEKAFEYHKEHTRISKELFDEEKQKIVAEMQARFDMENAEREKEFLQTKNIELAAAFDEVRQLNTTLQRLNDEKNEVLGIVAHDLKSPLSGVRMVASILCEHCRLLPVGELEKQLRQIVETCDRMLAISSHLLHAQHLEAGGSLGHATDVLVGNVVQAITDSYRPIAWGKNICLWVECPASIFLACNEEALRRAIENLISNAVKFTPAFGNVWVRVRQAEQVVVIEVEDEGPGISELDQQNLYGKYTRLSAQPTASENSTGLGLWIARNAVQTLKGSIRCTSRMGSGTIFTIEIPSVPDAISTRNSS